MIDSQIIENNIIKIQEQIRSNIEEKDSKVILLFDDYELPIIETIASIKDGGIVNDEGQRYDLEYKEIDGSSLSFDVADKMPTPTGKDGGVLIVNNFVDFIKKVQGTKQGNTISRLIGNFENKPTGWNVILVAIGNDELWMHSDCVRYIDICSVSLMYGTSELNYEKMYGSEEQLARMLKCNEEHNKIYGN